jgi:hypothetical protein
MRIPTIIILLCNYSRKYQTFFSQCGLQFAVITDCNALSYAINKANLNPRIARWTLQLQNYHFKMEHRPGKRMAYVDALSRQVYYIEPLPLERELEFKQLQDIRLKEIVSDLEYGENNRSDKFELIEGLVYKKNFDRSKFAVPETMTNNIIQKYHDEQAHCGFEKTFQGVNNFYWFPSMRKRIREYIDNCITCLMADSSANRLEGQLQSQSFPKVPFKTIHIDHFGPLQEAESFKYILVVIDAFTRFTWLFPTKTTSAKEVINHLTFLFNTFGNPEHLVTDRGSAFTSNEFMTFVNNLNVKTRKVAVASPWANGMVERVNRFLKSSLIKTSDSHEHWKNSLNQIQYVVNNTKHSSIKASPSKMLLGYV